MKKNFVRVMLFGALTLATVTYVGCKDYDDDIDYLQTQIDATAAGLAELQGNSIHTSLLRQTLPIVCFS